MDAVVEQVVDRYGHPSGATLSPDGVLEVPLGEGERASDRALELLEILA